MVVNVPVNLVDDAVHDALEELPGEVESLGSHKVGGGDGAENNNEAVDALVAHDTDGAAGVNGGVGLGDGVVETGLADLGDEDVVGLAGNLDLFGGDFAEDSDSDTG